MKNGSNFKTTDRRAFDSDGNVKPDADLREETGNSKNSTQADARTSGNKFKKKPLSEPEEYLPKIDFTTFIVSLHTSALIHLGAVENPTGEPIEVNLELAKQNIDMIEMIQEKTRGNLDEEESQVIENCLFDLRMRYIEEKKKADKR